MVILIVWSTRVGAYFGRPQFFFYKPLVCATMQDKGMGKYKRKTAKASVYGRKDGKSEEESVQW